RTRQIGRRAGPSIEVAVSDTGAGIDADVREKLFVPFFTTKQGGTGLGLPICRRIVEAHGGELDVHSVSGQGSTFVVRLDPEKLPSPAPLPRREAAR
ncbi:MAG: ATP-binding protein, partial [Myxococcota bacterium]